MAARSAGPTRCPPAAASASMSTASRGWTATAFGTRVTSSVPIVAERAMYWAGGFFDYYEGHVSSGATQTGAALGAGRGRGARRPTTPGPSCSSPTPDRRRRRSGPLAARASPSAASVHRAPRDPRQRPADRADVGAARLHPRRDRGRRTGNADQRAGRRRRDLLARRRHAVRRRRQLAGDADPVGGTSGELQWWCPPP